MTSTDSTTIWLDRLKAGETKAAAEIWERYYQRLINLARKRLADADRRVMDEEDAIQSVFDSFYRCVQVGQFPKLESKEDLWQILVMLTARKVINQRRHLDREKRGGGRKRGESFFLNRGSGSVEFGIADVIGDDPSPEFAVETAEELGRLLGRLGNESQREVALYKLQGYTNEEISRKLECSVSTVERKLRAVRTCLVSP